MDNGPWPYIPLLIFGFYIFMFAVGLASVIFWIIALVDVTRREFKEPNEKLMWVLVILLAQVIGALVYWFVGREKGRLVREAAPPHVGSPPPPIDSAPIEPPVPPFTQ